MAQHRSVSLSAVGWLRSFALSALHRAGAVVWQRNDGSCVEAREAWPDGTTGLSETPRGSRGSRLDAPYSVVSVNA
jgi:hypothetical protein